jgi:hypothetical protein
MLGLGKKNSLNDYEKGMVAGSKPFIEKYQQYADALNRLKDETQTHWQSAKTVADAHTAEITAIQKQQLFHLNTQSDIKEMADHEKELLTAILYTLAGEQSNENQQAYIRSVQNYLGIRNAQGQIDLSAVENIENIASQKAVLQACIEYLFLAKEDASFFEEYNDSLFCHFNVNDKTKLILWENAVKIYTAAGPQGLAEKYGFAAEEDVSLENYSVQDITLEPLAIDSIFHVPAGAKKTFTAKEICLTADIHCEGELEFDHCILTYNGDEITGQIRLGDNSKLAFHCCTICGENNPKRAEKSDKYFVDGKNAGYERNASVLIENSQLNDCLNFLHSAQVNLSNSKVHYTKAFTIPRDGGFLSFFLVVGKNLSEYRRLFEEVKDNSTVENCIFECASEEESDKIDCQEDVLIKNFSSISGCTFTGVHGCIDCSSTDIIKNCTFYFCVNVVIKPGSLRSSSGKTVIKDCLFENCKDIILNKVLTVSYCQFSECSGSIINMKLDFTSRIENCEFYNITSDGQSSISGRVGGNSGISFDVSPKSTGSFFGEDLNRCYISHCIFDGIHQENPEYTLGYYGTFGFISCSLDKGFKVFKKLMTALCIESCQFRHCVAEGETEIVHQQNTGDEVYAKETVVWLSDDCTGLDNVNKEGGRAENVSLRRETSIGEFIGAQLDKMDVGCNKK